MVAKILICDDEPDIVRLIARYAEREGYEVTQASDGREAIELCREKDYDLVIMDVMMPDTDGFTACKKIHESKDIPVLMLSARGTEYDKLFGFEVGIDDYVTKPFSPKELMARAKVIIRRHQGSLQGNLVPERKQGQPVLQVHLGQRAKGLPRSGDHEPVHPRRERGGPERPHAHAPQPQGR